jgi:hypothetical protein
MSQISAMDDDLRPKYDFAQLRVVARGQGRKRARRSTEMSWQIEQMSGQKAFLPAENTKMSRRSQQMSWQTRQMRTAIGKMSLQMVDCVRQLK